MSSVVLDIELDEKGFIENLRVFIDGIVQGYSFRSPKKYKPTKQPVWCTKNLHGKLWNTRPFDYSDLPNILPSDVLGEFIAKGTEKRRILPSLRVTEVENLDDQDCPKVQDLVVEGTWVC